MLDRRSLLRGFMSMSAAGLTRAMPAAAAEPLSATVEAPTPHPGFTPTAEMVRNLMISAPRSIGQTIKLDGTDEDIQATGGRLMGGSAILLDEDGTVSMCAHEMGDGRHLFMCFTTPEGEKTSLIKVEGLQIGLDSDQAFGRIDPAFIKQHGLRPIVWTPREDARGVPVLAVGYPAALDSLGFNVVYLGGEHDTFVAKDPGGGPVDGHRVACNAAFVGSAYGGESGGGVFDFVSGGLVGQIKNAGGSGTPEMDGGVLTDKGGGGRMTPSGDIWLAYSRLFPHAAAKATFTANASPPSRPSAACSPALLQFKPVS